MKALNKNEEIKKVAYRIPAGICEKLEKLAVINRRSINDELITILQDYFDMPVKWEKWIEETVKEIAVEKGYTVSWAVNFLVGMKLNDLDITPKENRSYTEKHININNPKKAAGE